MLTTRGYLIIFLFLGPCRPVHLKCFGMDNIYMNSTSDLWLGYFDHFNLQVLFVSRSRQRV